MLVSAYHDPETPSAPIKAFIWHERDQPGRSGVSVIAYLTVREAQELAEQLTDAVAQQQRLLDDATEQPR